jgi:hypothetical protein
MLHGPRLAKTGSRWRFQTNLIGNDIVNHFDLGYEFFNDDFFHVRYIDSDLLFPNSEMKQLHGQIDVISIVHVLHQWD